MWVGSVRVGSVCVSGECVHVREEGSVWVGSVCVCVPGASLLDEIPQTRV